MRISIVVAAILAFASVSRAQVYGESRPNTPPPATVAADDNSGYYTTAYDDCCLTALVVGSPSSLNGAGNVASAPAGPATAYGHGDAGWVPSTFVNYRLAVGKARQQQSAAQSGSNSKSRPNIPDQFRLLVLEKRGAGQNASGAQPNQQSLRAEPSSLGDMAREIREQEAKAPKAEMVMKQDARGKAVVGQKKPWSEYNAATYSREQF
jgi:hypothetical protein